ncbi:MAG TPA: hypothetical protein PLK58_05425 [Candidatus Rifleibacterium sp.]|jgi:hypothetical protein|nr:hypothetical protein [Candidatus Rifleibacterium sp.]
MKKLFYCRVCRGIFALTLAAVLWFSFVARLFDQPEENYLSGDRIAPLGRSIAARHIRFWTDPELRRLELEKMRSRNAEWDFMARCFFVWSLANMGLREPAMKTEVLPVIDAIIDETIRLEKEHGIHFFLMPYGKYSEFKMQPPRSIFIDGEIGLMLGLRRLLEEKAEYKSLHRERIDVMLERMQKGAVLCAESYPDECWLFCNSIGLAAIKVGDYLDGTDHSEFFARWLASARANLLDKETGILVSAYDLSGKNISDGPEGSTIWLVTHCLQLIDPEFAKEQYWLARKHLKADFLGFGYAYEWPGGKGHDDVDSGPILPLINLSAGSTGLAFLGAASFDDKEYLKLLYRSLEMGAFPVRAPEGIRYCASNAVGDAVLLYSITQGPAWRRIMGGGTEK